MQGDAQAVARAEVQFAVSGLNNGIAAAVAQLGLQLPQVKFVLLDWHSLVLDAGELACWVDGCGRVFEARLILFGALQMPMMSIKCDSVLVHTSGASTA